MFITVSVKIVIIKAKYLYTHTPNPAPLPPNVAYSLDHILHDCQMRKAKSPVQESSSLTSLASKCHVLAPKLP